MRRSLSGLLVVQGYSKPLYYTSPMIGKGCPGRPIINRMLDENHGWFSNPSVKLATVVFVHGVMAKKHKSWRSGDVFWPEMLSKEPSLANIGVYVFSYSTNLFTSEYGTPDVAQSLKETLKNEHILDAKPLIFVCHSHGGNVVRRFLVQNQRELADTRTRIGLVLIACPSTGSAYANLLSPLARVFRHAQARTLRRAHDNDWLEDLERLFVSFKDSPDITVRGKELIETKGIFPFFPLIVNRESGARYFKDWVRIPNSNHFTIANPAGPDAEQHRILLTFIAEFLAEPSPRIIRQEIHSFLPQPPPVLVGRRDLLDHLRQKLMPNDGPGQIVALSGGAGEGKSAVATTFANDPDVQQHYDRAVIWIRLRQEGAREVESSELRYRLYELARSVGLNQRDMEEVAGSNQERAAWIRSRLMGKKLLLVIDDVWTTTQGMLFNIINTNCGASMLLLSRSRDVARELTVDDNVFDLHRLSAKEATELLSRFSKSFVRDHPKECNSLVHSVKGLPLALNLVGSALRNEEPYGDLRTLVKRLSSLKELLSVNVPYQMAPHEGHVRKLLDLSIEMMSEEARTRFFKLGVFQPAATFDLRSVAYLWEDSEASARKYIRELISWSMISVESQTRFSVHALLQAYARERLPNIGAVERQHDRYYLDLAQSEGPRIRGHEYKRALSVLQEERNNIELALSRDESLEETVSAVITATKMADFWYVTGTCEQGFRILKRLISRAYTADRARNAQSNKNPLVRALCSCAYLAFFIDDSFKVEARTYWRQAGEIEPEELDAPTLAISLIGQLSSIENYDDNQHLEPLSRLIRTISDVETPVVVGDAWAAMGWSQYYGQAYHESIESLNKATAVYRSIGDKFGLIEALNGLVLSSTEVGEYDTGEAAFTESLVALDELGIESLGTGLHHNYGWMLLAKGEIANAKRAFRRSQEVNATLYGVEGVVGGGFVLEASACIAQAEGRYARAAKLYGAAAGRRGRTDDPLPEWMREQYRPWIEEVKEALTAEKFAELFRNGQTLSDQEAAEYDVRDED